MRQLRLWVSLLVSLFFLWLVFHGLDPAKILDTLRRADYRYLAPALALYFAGVGVRSVRWKALLSPIGRFSAASLFPVVVIGYMANDVLPARMGEVVRVYVLSQREGVSKTSALGTVVVERLLDAVTMLLLLAASALLVPLSGPIQKIGLFAALVLVCGLVPLVLLTLLPTERLAPLAALAMRLPGGVGERGVGAGGRFLSGLRVIRSWRAIAAALGLSVVAWLFEGGMYLVLARGFHLEVGASVILLTLAVANLATLVPAAPGYVGTFEFGARSVLSGLAGISWSVASGYVLVLHAALVVPVSLLGLYYWSSHHLSLYRIQREAALARRGEVRANSAE